MVFSVKVTLLFTIQCILHVNKALAQCPSARNCTSCAEGGSALCANVCPENINIPANTREFQLVSPTCEQWLSSGILKASYLNVTFSGYLQKLDLSRTGIKTITIVNTATSHLPPPFQQLTKLQALSLAHNIFTRLPPTTFTGLDKVEELDLSNNGLVMILPDTFKPLTSLKNFTIAHNNLTALTKTNLDGLTQLETIDISSNPITTIAGDTFSSMSLIQSILMRDMSLTSFSSGLFSNLHSLRHVDASGNQITSLADDCLSGTSLDQLDLSNNRLTNIPTKAIQQASNQPKTLDLSNNKITQVSHQDMTSLTVETLDLSGNPLAQIVDGTFDGCTIKHIDLSNTGLTSLPASIQPWQTGGPTSLILDNPFWTGNVDILLLSRDLAKTCNPTTTYLADALTAALQQRENTCPTHTFATSTTIKTTPSRQTTTCSTGAVVVTEEIVLGLLVTMTLCLM